MYKKIIHWWHGRRERFYHRSRWHLVLDISLSILVVLLAGIAGRLSFYHPAVISALNLPNHQTTTPTTTADKLDFKVEAQPVKSAAAISENIVFNINYENTGNLKIEKLALSLKFDSAAFQLLDLKADSKQAAAAKEQIVLPPLAPGESGHLALTVKWQPGQKDFPRSLQGRLQIQAENGEKQTIKEFILPEIKLISDLQVRADLYYNSPQGDQLGIGPIPPVVGLPTTYWLIIKAANSGNELHNLLVSARLPAGVELSGSQSLLAGKFSYNKDSRRLIWQINSLSAKDGSYISNFGLTLIPRKDQAGKNALLLEDLQYQADDAWTGTEISGQQEDLDSSLPADRLNRGRGLVITE